MVAGVPSMCIAQTPTPLAAASGIIAGSAVRAETSLMISAPASMAARATAALVVSIEIGTGSLPARSFSTPSTRPSSSARLVGVGVGARAFAADVDQIGPGGGHFQCPIGGGPRIVIGSAVGEAVGRHVDDAHHQRTAGEFDVARAEQPTRGAIGKTRGQ